MDRQRWNGVNDPQANIGSYAIMLGAAVRQRDIGTLRDIIRSIAMRCDDTDAKWIFKTAKQDLPEDLKQWMDGAIEQIRGNFDAE